MSRKFKIGDIVTVVPMSLNKHTAKIVGFKDKGTAGMNNLYKVEYSFAEKGMEAPRCFETVYEHELLDNGCR